MHVWEKVGKLCLGSVEFEALVGHSNGGFPEAVRKDLGGDKVLGGTRICMGKVN